MRYKLLILLIPVLLLVACDGDVPANDPAATQVPVVETTPEPTPVVNVVVTRVPREEGELEVPMVGTLVASVTEDPEMGLVFDVITLRREGGQPDEEPLEIILNQDGSYTRNGIAGSITAEQVTRIDDELDAINFFGLQGTLMGPAIQETDYRYTLRVERNGLSRAITSQDGYMPTPYQSLLGSILDVGFRIGT